MLGLEKYSNGLKKVSLCRKSLLHTCSDSDRIYLLACLLDLGFSLMTYIFIDYDKFTIDQQYSLFAYELGAINRFSVSNMFSAHCIASYPVLLHARA